MDEVGRVTAKDWAIVVESVPIVSVDLVVEVDGRVLLGRRTNEPGNGEWFVPGGRVHKGETLTDAVHRVADEEVGADVTIETRLGVYEHFWETSDVASADGKHYVPVGFHVTLDDDAVTADDQHDALRLFEPPFEGLDLHPYVDAYLTDAGFETA